MNYRNLQNTKLTDVSTYNTRMRRAFLDKVFFLDKIPGATCIADFGCADGAVIEFAHTLCPEFGFLGYDKSPDMVKLAINNCPFAAFTETLEEFDKAIKFKKTHGSSICLSLLSIIHEVYHYGPSSVSEFWNFAFRQDLFDFIAIRDMMVSRSTSRPSDPISVAKIKVNYDKERVSQWESRWGSLHENWSLVHFLLTYQYVNSWERECYENYLPLSLEDFLNIIPEGWEPFYIDHYTLPYLRQCVQNDFGIDLQDRTHLKLILKRVP